MDAQGNPQVIPDINVYQQKKNLAQGMMDLALLSANANQLRYVLETYVRHPYYWFSLISITISLILQVSHKINSFLTIYRPELTTGFFLFRWQLELDLF